MQTHSSTRPNCPHGTIFVAVMSLILSIGCQDEAPIAHGGTDATNRIDSSSAGGAAVLDANLDALTAGADTRSDAGPGWLADVGAANVDQGPTLSTDATTTVPEDRIDPTALTYLGGFRVPVINNTDIGQTLSYGGNYMAYHPGGDGGKGSLFISGHPYGGLVAEISVPTPVLNTDVGALPIASMLQPLRDPTGGMADQISSTYGVAPSLGGMLSTDGRLMWALYQYYDVSGDQDFPSLGSSATDLAHASPKGPWRLGSWYSHNYSGYLAEIPPSYRSSLSGFHILAGKTNAPGEGNRNFSSEGPAAFGFDPQQTGTLPDATFTFASVEYLYYTLADPLRYTVEGTTHAWKGANSVGGMAFSASSDASRAALVFVATVGLQPGDCYGEGWADCQDACDNSKGFHAYPYRAVAFYYDPRDLVRVGSGTTRPEDVKPYATVDLTPWFFTRANQCDNRGGVSYDPTSRRLFIAELDADNETGPYQGGAVIHVFSIAP